MFSAIKNILNPSTERDPEKSTGTRHSNTASAIDVCNQLLSVGDLDGAEQCAREVIAASPDTGEAWYYLGMISYRRGDGTGALELLKTASELCPHHAEIQNHYGNALRSHGNFGVALEQYRKAADLKAGYAAPVYNIGLIQLALGNPEDAAISFENALAIDPHFTAALSSLGIIRLEQNNYREAERLFRAVLKTSPDSIEGLNNLAISLTKLKCCEEAQALCRQALAIKSDSAEIFNTLGIALRDSGCLEEAVASYSRALELDPVNPYFLNNLGSALRETGNVVEGIASLRNALALKPDYVVAWHNLGISLGAIGKLEEAVEAFHHALKVRPGYTAVLNDLGGILAAQGEIEAAVEVYQRALESDPQNMIAFSNLLLTMQYSSVYSPQDIYQKSILYEQRSGVLSVTTHSNDPDPDRKLIIGYVSPDFCRHSVSYFLRSLFACHTRSNVSIICYSDVRIPDEHTSYYREKADIWRNICGLNDDDVVEIINNDRVDILVDLAGHTGQRLTLFAKKPAPVQISWLGFPGTTGLHTVDYRFTDEIADPVGVSDRYCTEKLYRLPDGFLCYTAPCGAPEVVSPPSIRSGLITFGSFNNVSKLTPEVARVWNELLQLVPDSRLIIKSHSLADSFTCNRFRELICKDTISDERVEFRQRVKKTESHLSVYGEIDIALDTFPYNGTTTTCEALWMGVPVVTMYGDRHAGRVGASILSRIGYDDLVADSTEAFIEITRLLAGDLQRRTVLRRTLRETMISSRLCDGYAFASAVEGAYRQFWQTWCVSGR